MGITAQFYRISSAESGSIDTPKVADELKRPDTILWIDLQAPDESDLTWLAGIFSLPGEVLDSLRGIKKMPPLLWQDDTIFLRCDWVRYNASSLRVENGPFHMIVDPRWLVTVHGPSPDILLTLRRQWEGGRLGEYALAYSWFLAEDALINSYHEAAYAVRSRIDLLVAEDEKSGNPTSEVSALRQQLYVLLRLLRSFRKSAHSLQVLMHGDVHFLLQKEHSYFKIIVASVSRVEDDIHVYLKMLDETLQEYQSAQADWLNNLVYQLTILATVLATFEVFVGMFSVDLSRIFPGLRPIFGALIILGFLAVVAVLEIAFFRKRGWLKGK